MIEALTDPTALARLMHGVVEPYHAVMYFAPELKAAWEKLGLEPTAQGYVAGRVSPMGAVGPDVAAATFFNFSPVLSQLALPSAWAIASPAEVYAARCAAMEAFFVRIGAPRDGLDEATEIARDAASACDLPGRPLAAANSAMPLPGTPFADIFQLLTTVREHRGDGHVALLVGTGLTPAEVVVLYAAWQPNISRRFLQGTRLWDDDAWTAAEGSLSDQGLLGPDGLTPAGQHMRDTLEAHTDRLASRPWAAVGVERARVLHAWLAVTLEKMNDAGAWKRPVTWPAFP